MSGTQESVLYQDVNKLVYGAVISGQVDAELGQKVSNQALEVGRNEFLRLKKYAEEGDWSWRVAGFAAGCFMMFTSFFGFFSNFFGLSPFLACLNIYIFCFGVLSVCMEYKDQMLTAKYIDLIRREAHFLTTPYGRAAFYFFVGVLMVCKGGILDFVAGLFLAIIGVIIFHSSRKSYAALETIRGQRHSETELRARFRAYDANKNGQLDSKELAALCLALGTTLTRNELETALFLLDKDGNGEVSEEEFLNWYLGR